MRRRTLCLRFLFIPSTLWGWIIMGMSVANAQYVPVADEFRVHAQSDSQQDSACVAISPDGTSVVAWDSEDGETLDQSIYARLFDENGLPLSDEIQLNVHNLDDQATPAVEMTPSRGFVAVWESRNQANDSSSMDIYARIFDASGQALSDEIQINETSVGHQMVAQLEVIPSSGNFVVIWVQAIGANCNVFFRIFDEMGNPLTGEIPANEDDIANDYLPTLAVDGVGNLVIGWGRKIENQFDIYFRRFNSTGDALGASILVNSMVNGDQHDPDIAMNSTGDFIVVWDSLTNGNINAMARLYDPNGEPRGEEFQLNETQEGYAPQVAMNENGVVVAVWESRGEGQYGSYAQIFIDGDSISTSDFLIHSQSDDRRLIPHVDITPDGSYFIAVWNQVDHTNTSDIYARIFRYSDINSTISDFAIYE